MSQLERILQRQPHVDAAELEGVRARSKARLEAISVPTRRDVPVPIEVMDVDVDAEAVDDLDDTVGHAVAEDILAVEAEDDASVADEPLAEAADADPPVATEPADADPDEPRGDTSDADRWFAVGPGQPTEGSSDDQPVPDESPDESFDDSSPLALSGPTSDWVQPEGLWDPLVQVASEYDETRAELAETTAIATAAFETDQPTPAEPLIEPPTDETPIVATAPATAARRTTRKAPQKRHAVAPRVVATAYCPYCAAHLDPPPTADRRVHAMPPTDRGSQRQGRRPGLPDRGRHPGLRRRERAGSEPRALGRRTPPMARPRASRRCPAESRGSAWSGRPRPRMP